MRGIAGVAAQRIQGQSRLVLLDNGKLTVQRIFLSQLLHAQSKELTRGPPELVQHFCL
jgi:hypothetical protein